MHSQVAGIQENTAPNISHAPPDNRVDYVTQCPCCGSEMRLRKPRVDRAAQTVTWRGTAKATMKEIWIAEVLAARFGYAVSIPSILDALYAHLADPPQGPTNCMRVMVSKLRAKLAPIGLTINAVYGGAYKMEPLQ